METVVSHLAQFFNGWEYKFILFSCMCVCFVNAKHAPNAMTHSIRVRGASVCVSVCVFVLVCLCVLAKFWMAAKWRLPWSPSY